MVNEATTSYQSENALERELIQDLINQGFENPTDIKSNQTMLANVRTQLQALNNVIFIDAEWQCFVPEYLDKPGDTLVDKSRKIHDNYIYDFTFGDRRLQNIYLVDKKNIVRNKLQVISQFEQAGKHANRYDVTMLVNGLPLVQVELKKRGVAIREAFNQVHRYSKESLVVDFINETNLDEIPDKASIIDSFFVYAQEKQKAKAAELINDEHLNEEAAKRYIATSLKREYASENGTELNSILPKMSPLNPQYLIKKQSVFQK